ncbi:MAG TPA: hypothetical protein VLV48_01685 [Thermoanaerobaculia bacterium]|nr:hypothetical protein [Thermoanaerobaculia bacterium]
MNTITSLFRIQNLAEAILILFALVLLAILIISFRSRAVVFCQYLHVMTGVSLSPAEVRRVFRAAGKNGVRETLLDLLIRQDFEEQGPVAIPEGTPGEAPEMDAGHAVASKDKAETTSS